MRNSALALIVGGLLVGGPIVTAAQDAYVFEDVVFLSCAEVADKVGDSEAEIVAMVTVLTQFALERRQLAVPEGQQDLALRFGELIKAYCTADPDGLLFNAVHKAMRRLL